MKVIGYSSAWPSLELWNFQHWNSRMKMFMDVTGEPMDGFATHFYDGINIAGQDTKRSGSNSEAILDMIEAYSYIKWGEVKPHAITEYGGIEKGYPAEYSDVKSIQSVRSMNRLMMNLMEREDDLMISIPFIGDKALWHLTAANNYQPYGSVLFIPTNLGEPHPDGWEYSARILFFDLWKGVKGKRLHLNSTNPDVQVQAFLDETKIYVVLNNLSEKTINSDLSFKNVGENYGADKRSLMVYPDQDTEYVEEHISTLPESVSLRAGETIVYVITTKEVADFDNSITRKKYYSTNYLEPIKANKAIEFSYNGVETGTGYAKLRMSTGRKHNVSKQPTVIVNGKDVSVPANWKGYDQANREDFFGMIEIPVPMSYITENTSVKVTFPDNGGHVASMILETEKFKNDVKVPAVLSSSGIQEEPVKVYPNPSYDWLTVELPEKDQWIAKLFIYDHSAKEVFSSAMRFIDGKLLLNIADLSLGTYTLVIDLANEILTSSFIRK
uniref:MS130, putative beta-agarase n=2 Tax=Microscilla sp. PRE1 TaxID=155537 RepID=Q93PA1_9BACT|nr:MS130, putative beta-agarase [Microscilla sp. PRE1]